MGLLDGFEKLINEHGSAAILKERIELANDKYAALETKATSLESENKALRADLGKATAEILQLKKLVAKPDDTRLEDTREKVLLIVANNPEANDQQVAQLAGVSLLISTFHLEELRKTKMVSAQYTAGSDWTGSSPSTLWSVAQPGLSYLVQHALIA